MRGMLTACRSLALVGLLLILPQTAVADGDRSDAEQIAAARESTAEAIRVALERLTTPNERAYAAIQRWLKVSPSTDYYAATIAKERDTLTRMLSVLHSVSIFYSEVPCREWALACVDINRPERGLRVGPMWFPEELPCQRSVLLHELGHLVGLVHNLRDPGQPDEFDNLKPAAQLTREEALRSANTTAQLVDELFRGQFNPCAGAGEG